MLLPLQKYTYIAYLHCLLMFFQEVDTFTAASLAVSSTYALEVAGVPVAQTDRRDSSLVFLDDTYWSLRMSARWDVHGWITEIKCDKENGRRDRARDCAETAQTFTSAGTKNGWSVNHCTPQSHPERVQDGPSMSKHRARSRRFSAAP